MRRVYAIYRYLLKFALRRQGFFNWENMAVSGEDWLLNEILAGLLTGQSPLILDVGANSGDYTELVLKRIPDAKVHAFEPHPTTFRRLCSNIQERAKCHQQALGSQPGEMDLFDCAEGDEEGIRASLCKQSLEATTSKPLVAVPVKVTTLDLFLKANGIERVDFLKIDTEGFEMDVLNGGSEALAAGSIGVVQFEFNALHIGRRQFLIDFMEKLPRHKLYRLLSDGMVALENLKPYEREIFAFQNIVAIPRSIAPSKS